MRGYKDFRKTPLAVIQRASSSMWSTQSSSSHMSVPPIFKRSIHRFVDPADLFSNPHNYRFKALPTTVMDGKRCRGVGNFLDPHGKLANCNYNYIIHIDPHLSQRRTITLALLFADCSWVSSILGLDLLPHCISVRQFRTGSVHHNQHLSKHSFIRNEKWVFGRVTIYINMTKHNMLKRLLDGLLVWICDGCRSLWWSHCFRHPAHPIPHLKLENSFHCWGVSSFSLIIHWD